MKGNRVKRLVYLGFSLVVTVSVFSYLLTHVSVDEIVELILGADRRGIAMFLLLSAAMSVFRTWRYNLVLRTAGYTPSSVALFLVVIVRNFFSDLLPARLGTLVYVYIVTQRLGVPFGAAASSFALSFVFDLIALAPMIMVAAVLAGAGSGMSPGMLLTGGLVLGAVTCVGLYLLPFFFSVATRMLESLTRRTHGRTSGWLKAWQAADEDIQRARRAGIYGRMLVLSLLVRVTKYGSLYVFLFALIGPLGYGFARLRVSRVFLGLCASEFAASLPISGIAGFGAYEGAWNLSFQLLGFPAHIARLTSISHHAFTQLYGYSLGAAALAVLLLPCFKPRGGATEGDTGLSRPGAFYARVAATIGLAALGLWACYQWPWSAV